MTIDEEKDMRALRIPDEEKAKGLMWVIYPVIEDGYYPVINDGFDVRIIGFAELQIRQGKN